MNPLLLELPVPIETTRLLIRPAMAGDGPALYEAVNETFDQLHLWMPWAQEKMGRHDFEEFARRESANWILRKNLHLNIFEKTSGKLVGSSGLHRLNWLVPAAEIGFWLRKSYHGQGLITESTAAIARYAFSVIGAKRTEIRCDADNFKSKAVAERLGFTLEGRLRNDEIKVGPNLGRPRDTLVYACYDVRNLLNVNCSWPDSNGEA